MLHAPVKVLNQSVSCVTPTGHHIVPAVVPCVVPHTREATLPFGCDYRVYQTLLPSINPTQTQPCQLTSGNHFRITSPTSKWDVINASHVDLVPDHLFVPSVFLQNHMGYKMWKLHFPKAFPEASCLDCAKEKISSEIWK